MADRPPASQRGYYFALPRLWAFLTGRAAQRNDQNWIEAYFAGVAIFVVSYATLVTLFDAGLLLAIALLFVTWITWLPVFSLNALVVNTLRALGICTHVSAARAQNVIIGIEISACAIALTTQPDWALLGWGWLLLAITNLVAALALRMMMPSDA